MEEKEIGYTAQRQVAKKYYSPEDSRTCILKKKMFKQTLGNKERVWEKPKQQVQRSVQRVGNLLNHQIGGQ